MTASSVGCRSAAFLSPPRNNANRSASRVRISSTDIARAFVAASSVANGKPSRRVTMSVTTSSSSRAVGRAASARRRNSSTAYAVSSAASW